MMRQTARQHAKPASSKVRANPNRWSDSSQRSYAVASIQWYEDLRWTCRGCGQAFVFTAEEQQQAFEVEHVYIWYRPVLCAACNEKRQQLAESIRTCEMRWRVHKQTLQQDSTFLQEWLTWLEAYARVGGRRNQDLIHMLRKRLQQQPG